MLPKSTSKYVFDNATPDGGLQLHRLAAVLDDHTFTLLSSIPVQEGWRCLELGAGAGTVADWLAHKVGPDGSVLAIDLKPRYTPALPNTTIVAHDLRDPLPSGSFDLIHARLVLMHISERRDILRRAADALAPGGAIVVEDWECSWRNLVLKGTPEQRRVMHQYLDAYLGILEAGGADLTWAREVNAAMSEAGLAQVRTIVSGTSSSGGSDGCLLHVNLAAQLRGQLLDGGMNHEDLDLLADTLNDPEFVLTSYLMYSTVGRKASADTAG